MVEKCSERIPLNLTETELLDLSRAATLDDRSVAEFIRVRVIRPYLYGNSRRTSGEVQQSNGASEAPGGPGND